MLARLSYQPIFKHFVNVSRTTVSSQAVFVNVHHIGGNHEFVSNIDPENCQSHIHSIPRELGRVITQGRRDQQQQKSAKSKNQQISTPQQPLDSLLEIQASVPVNQPPQRSRQLSATHRFPGINQKLASNSSFHHQDIYSSTKNQHQLPVSTTRQQHHISQPPARQPANQLLTLPPCHTHTMAARSVVV